MNQTPGFIANLAAALAGDPLRERVLLAPTHRVGRQWLDQAAFFAGGVANVRAVTIKRLVLDLAEQELRQKGLRPATRAESMRVVGECLGKLGRGDGDGYFTKLPLNQTLAATLSSSLDELEAAVRDPARKIAGKVSPPEKADELARLCRLVAAERRGAGFAGIGEIHAAALAAAGRGGFAAPRLLIPESMTEELLPGERAVLSRWSGECKTVIREDDGGRRAPVERFVADHVQNEAREVFRRIQDEGILLDQVEVVCIDPENYVPAICAAGLEVFGGRPEDLPITFNSGLPGWYSRPVRQLSAWLEWLDEGLPPEGLARMVDSGLLGQGWREEAPGVSAMELAARVRALPVDGEPGRYRRCLGMDDVSGRLARAEAWLARLLFDIVPLDRTGDKLELGDQAAVLEAAAKLVALRGDGEGKLDAYARASLAEEIGRWLPHSGWDGFNALSWLARLAASLRVMGLGPMAGRMHVGDLHSGGHAGRAVTFVMGLDEGRFPGGAGQDPVLLDRERLKISPDLPLSGVWRRRREKAFARLLARARGKVVLSHAKSDSGGGLRRELFPAAVFMEPRRGTDNGETPAVLTPARESGCLNRRDDWLSLLLAWRRNSLTASDLGKWHPHLAHGAEALAARAGKRFGAYDGFVPDAGAAFFGDAGQAVSPTDLELLAKCPLEFFFKRVLRVGRPERFQPVAGRWLEPRERGNLLHDLFQRFLTEAGDSKITGDAASLARHGEALHSMLVEEIDRRRKADPPRDPLVLAREHRDLEDACSIFLRYEAERQDVGRPLYFEVSLGGIDEPLTPWDRATPVELDMADGLRLRLRGRIDRIDRLEAGGLVIFDYKTGRSDKFSPADPFRQGRHLQHLLYSRMLETALDELGRREDVVEFAYFFPAARDEGKTVSYSRGLLREEGTAILADLARLLASGCFPFTTDSKDVLDMERSDYQPIYGDCKALAAATAGKLSEPVLAPWARLRGLGDT